MKKEITAARLAALVLAVLLIFGTFPVFTLSAYAESGAENAQQSVVRVFVPVSDNEASLGSGFAVGEKGKPINIIVTNYHVVKEDTRNVYVTVSDVRGAIKADVIYSDEYKDIAILRTENSITDRKPITLRSPSTMHKSDDVYCIGFPGLTDEVSGNYLLSSGIEDMTVTKGSISNPKYEVQGIKYILSDTIVNSGNSGGPMVDKNGNAIGMNTALIEDNNSMTLALSMDHIMDALDKKDIKYIEVGSSINYILIASICAAAVVIAVVIILLLRNKAHTPKLVVRCERGPIAGKEVIAAENVRVGRIGETCQFVFPSDTPGVSKQHCEIKVSNGQIMVTDLNSSYGTYLSNGTKLVPGENKILSSGDFILLGSEKVVLSAQLCEGGKR